MLLFSSSFEKKKQITFSVKWFRKYLGCDAPTEASVQMALRWGVATVGLAMGFVPALRMSVGILDCLHAGSLGSTGTPLD